MSGSKLFLSQDFQPLPHADSYSRVACVLLQTLQTSFRHPDGEDFTIRDWEFRAQSQHSRLNIVEPFGLEELKLEEIFISVHGYKNEVNSTVKYHIEVKAECTDYRGENIPLKMKETDVKEVVIALDWDANLSRGPFSSKQYKAWNEMPWDEILRLLRLRAATKFDEHGQWRTMADSQRIAQELGSLFP